jgi:hypothetical protein
MRKCLDNWGLLQFDYGFKDLIKLIKGKNSCIILNNE